MKKIIYHFILALFVSGLVVQVSHANPKPKIRLKVATIAPKGHSSGKRWKELSDKITKLTNNEVGFKVYWNGVQGDDKNVLRKMRLGQLHGAFFTGEGLGLIVPSVRVMEIPYVFKTADETNYVYENIQKEMEPLFEAQGFKVISWLNIGFLYNFSKVKITSLEVLKSQKCWVPSDDPMGQALYQALDITPVPLSLNDVLTSVSTNLIDTAPMTTFGAMAFRYYTRFNYMSDQPILHKVGAEIIAKKMWDRISPQSQQVIMDLAAKNAKKRNNDLKKANDRSYELLQKEGIEIVHFDSDKEAQETRFLIDAGVKARESMVGKLYSRELLDKTMSLLNDYRINHVEANSLSLAD